MVFKFAAIFNNGILKQGGYTLHRILKIGWWERCARKKVRFFCETVCKAGGSKQGMALRALRIIGEAPKVDEKRCGVRVGEKRAS